MANYFLAIDQGTTSSRAIIFDQNFHILSVAQQEFTQYFPASGWVEHDANEIWESVVRVCQEAIKKAHLNVNQITAIGISNQRETTVLWDRKTGSPVARAIVWQDRRTADYCAALKAKNHEAWVREKTGLLLDPYFSASKIRWLLDQSSELQARAKQGEIAFGTIESFLVWKLTGGQVHVSDVTNASRTLLMNIRTRTWDDDLLALFDIPKAILPEIVPNAKQYGATEAHLFGEAIPICGMAGDQQAALIGQACINAGMLKTTLGTGAFLVLNTGEHLVFSKHQLLTTVAYQVDEQIHYALEGSVFNAGTGIKWLRDQLQIIKTAAETENLARSLDSNDGVYLVPAFTGLGAPYWQPEVRGAIYGMTRATSKAHFARAALEAVSYQLNDISLAMAQDTGHPIEEMRLDGGLTANHWLLQFIADIVNAPILLASNSEASSLGAAILASVGSGCYDSLKVACGYWHASHKFLPSMSKAEREGYYQGWLQAIQKTCS